MSKTLGVTEDAARTLLKSVGMSPDIPEERLPEALTKAAADYKQMQAQIAIFHPDNAEARSLGDRAKVEIDAGNFQQAHELLRRATQAQLAAAQALGDVIARAQATRDTQMLGAAN